MPDNTTGHIGHGTECFELLLAHQARKTQCKLLPDLAGMV